MFDIDDCLMRASKFLPDQFPLKDFIHQNTLYAFQDKPFHEALMDASGIFGANCYMEPSFYRLAYQSGRINAQGINKVLTEHFPESEAQRDEHRVKMLNFLKLTVDPKPLGAAVIGLRQSWYAELDIDIDKRSLPMLFKILGNYLDQGISIWRLPHIHEDFWSCVGKIISESFLPIAPITDPACRQLLEMKPCEVIEYCLGKIVGDESLYETYLTEILLTLPGWAGMVRVIEKHPEFLHSRRSLHLKDVLALELCFELGWLTRKKGANFGPIAARKDILEKFEHSQKVREELVASFFLKKLWHEAYEWVYYEETIEKIKNKINLPTQTNDVPKVQALFCIDDRSCSIRRHIESIDARIETFGTPGFFGIDFLYQSLHSRRPAKHCPFPVQPKFMVKEVSKLNPRLASRGPIPSQIVSQGANTLFRGWFITQVLGISAAIRLAFAVFQPFLKYAVVKLKSSPNITELELLRTNDTLNEEGLYSGYSYHEMADRVEGVLKSIGMKERFAPLVVLLAHGASSVNNPHFAAYDCGACSGKHGAPNSRSFAWMANNKEVRALLGERGLIIPSHTRFIPAMHNTTTDEVTYFDTNDLSEEHAAIFARFHTKMNEALDLNAKERCQCFELIEPKISARDARMHVRLRAAAIFEPRPELNHANNALCIIGKRDFTKGISFDRRAFLQSYDHRCDESGDALAAILGAAVPVCGGINLEYFFSRMDNLVYGAGTKLPHNVNGLVGVTNGVQGDLRTGLPSQMTEMHEPVRLFIVVEQNPTIALKAAQKNSSIFQWIDHEWIRFATIEPDTKDVFIWQNSQFRKLDSSIEGIVK